MNELEEAPIPDGVPQAVAQAEGLDTAEERFAFLVSTFSASLAVIARMQENRDWETLTKDDGTHYKNLADLVKSALQISDSYARRLVQTARDFYAPLEAITVEGTLINITSSEAVALGSEGMGEVVEGATEKLEGEDDPERQSDIINEVKDSVIGERKRAKDIDDDFDDFDDLDDDLEFTGGDYAESGGGRSNQGKNQDDGDFGDYDEDYDTESQDRPKQNSKPKATQGTQEGADYLSPVKSILEGGQEYKDEESIATLPEGLQEFVRAVRYLADLDAEKLAQTVTEDRRGVIYEVDKARSKLLLLSSSVEMSPWVLEKL